MGDRYTLVSQPLGCEDCGRKLDALLDRHPDVSSMFQRVHTGLTEMTYVHAIARGIVRWPEVFEQLLDLCIEDRDRPCHDVVFIALNELGEPTRIVCEGVK